MQNGLQLNPDKSEALIVGTANQLHAKSIPSSVSVASTDMPAADRIKVLRVVLDHRLSFARHATTLVARACNFHAHAIRHISHLLTTELALTLVCSLILSRLDYCNAVLHCAPYNSIQKLQRIQNTATRIVLQAPRQSPSRPLLERLHWLSVRQCIDYKLAVLIYKISVITSDLGNLHSTSVLHPHLCYTNRLVRLPELTSPTGDRVFQCSAPAVWNSLNTNQF